MKRYAVTLILIFAFVLSCKSQPKIEIVGGDTYDWKKVSISENPLKAKIQIKNAGTEKLIINEVKPGCGCTTAPLDKSELAPGEVANLDVTLRISAGQHDVMKSIRISSNDPNNPNKILFLKANVFQPIEVSPTTYFPFNEMTVGKEATSTLKLKNNTDKPVKLSKIEITPEDVFVNLKGERTLKPGEEIDITAKTTPKKTGYFNCTLKINTDSPDMPEVVITGFGQIKESPLFNNK